MTKLSTNSDLRVTKVFYRCSLRNSTLKVNNYSEKQILGKKSYHLNLVLLHGMMLFQWFLYNLMWYTFLFSHLKYHILVLKVLQSNFYLSIYFFSTLNLSFDVKWDSGTKSENPTLDFSMSSIFLSLILYILPGCG